MHIDRSYPSVQFHLIIGCSLLQVPPFLDFMITWLALSNSFWNPFLYWLLNNHFRRISKELLLSKVRVTE
jgi:hypothetical protein